MAILIHGGSRFDALGPLGAVAGLHTTDGESVPLDGLQMPAFFEAEVAFVADHDVIEDRNSEQLARRGKSPGDVAVIERRTRIARRMVVSLMCRRSLCGGSGVSTPILRRSLLREGT
jgi:hypothetical protein